MNNNQADLFLDTYKRLETAAEGLVGSNGRSSSILRLSHLPAFSQYREELDYCRQVRNLLTHEAKIGGAYGVTPSAQLISVLEKVLREIENPPTVGEFMTPVSRLLTAKMEQAVAPMLTVMDREGVSYLPILEQGRVAGVFSLRALLRFLTAGGQLNDQLTFAMLGEILLPHKHKGLRFVPPDLSLERGRQMFQWVSGKHQRVKLLLVTKEGRPDRPLMGIVSPYDILQEE